jgi:hypothetical protein
MSDKGGSVEYRKKIDMNLQMNDLVSKNPEFSVLDLPRMTGFYVNTIYFR